MDYNQKSLKLHEELKGKIEVISRVKVGDAESLATAYTPGVAAPTLEISKNPENSYVYTRRMISMAALSDRPNLPSVWASSPRLRVARQRL